MRGSLFTCRFPALVVGGGYLWGAWPSRVFRQVLFGIPGPVGVVGGGLRPGVTRVLVPPKRGKKPTWWW